MQIHFLFSCLRLRDFALHMINEFSINDVTILTLLFIAKVNPKAK